MGNKPQNKGELLTWVTSNQGAELLITKTNMVRDYSGQHEFKMEEQSKKRKIVTVQTNGVYLSDMDSQNRTWFGIEGIPEQNFMFKGDYFAVFLPNIVEKDGSEGAQLLTFKYEYVESLANRSNVRWVLNTSVSDIDHYKGNLTEEELIYCLQNEKRKTGIKKLIAEAKKRPTYWNKNELWRACNAHE